MLQVQGAFKNLDTDDNGSKAMVTEKEIHSAQDFHKLTRGTNPDFSNHLRVLWQGFLVWGGETAGS